MKYTLLIFLACLFLCGSLKGQQQSPDKTELDKFHRELETRYKAGQLDAALQTAEQILALTIKTYGEESIETARAFSNTGALFRELKNYAASAENYQKAVDIYRKDEAKNAEALANAMVKAGYALTFDNKLEAAENIYKDAVAVAEKHIGKNDKRLLSYLQSLVDFYLNKSRSLDDSVLAVSVQGGDVEKIAEALTRAQAIAVNIYQPGSPELKRISDQFCLYVFQNLDEDKFHVALLKFQRISDVEYEKSKGKLVIKGVLNGEAVKLPTPLYPGPVRAVGASGEVVVRTLVDETGKVISAKAISGHPLLRQSAVQAARGAVFKPAILNGKAIMISGRIVYTFEN